MWRPLTASATVPGHLRAATLPYGEFRPPWRCFLRRLAVGAAVLLPLTALFWFTQADVALSRLFYGGPHAPWPATNHAVWHALYRFGNVPGLALGLGALGTAVASFAWKRLRTWRDPSLFLAALLLLGPGLVVNGLVKPYWNRPRPRDITEFGGPYAFARAWEISAGTASGKSFPCGHASMGFYLIGPAFLVRGHGRRWAGVVVTLGLATGVLLGLSRVIQGGHFVSDVVWSGGMVYLAAIALSGLFEWWRVTHAAPPSVVPAPRILQFPAPAAGLRRAA